MKNITRHKIKSATEVNSSFAKNQSGLFLLVFTSEDNNRNLLQVTDKYFHCLWFKKELVEQSDKY